MEVSTIKLSPQECTDKHTREFYLRYKDECAATQFNLRQALFYFLLCPAALALAFVLDYKIAFAVLTFALCAFYGGVVFVRMLSVLMALIKSPEHRVSQAEIDALIDADLPIYTVLVPMYKEPAIAQKIARTVTKLNYPLDKLDVKLLLEEDDAETRAKIDEVIGSLPPCVEVVIAPRVPVGQPRTKPRACNWGLERARGKYLVIFDAEDQPEADQLKKAVVVFNKLQAQGKSKVVCLQAKLNYFNADQNWLTGFFTLEYTTWFDLFLPGLHRIWAPIPLGGTSNHFKTDVLKQLGGWDSFNVTEDCDLGIRLARQGQSTEVLDSTTWEEANSNYGNWVRQRSRWIKGYFQSHLVHTRDGWLPSLLLAAFFGGLAGFAQSLRSDPQLLAKHATGITVIQALAALLGLLSLGCAAVSFFKRLRARSSGVGGGQLNPWQALMFRFTIGGLSAMLLLNVFFWAMTALYLLRHQVAALLPGALANLQIGDSSLYNLLNSWELWHQNVIDDKYSGITIYSAVFSRLIGKIPNAALFDQLGAIDPWSVISQIFYPIAMMLFFGNFLIVMMGLISCAKRNLWRLFPYALLMPFYWVLISRAALKGFFQLFTNPWYWEKTTHGLTHATASAEQTRSRALELTGDAPGEGHLQLAPSASQDSYAAVNSSDK